MYLGPGSKGLAGRLSLGRVFGGQRSLWEIIQGCQLGCLKGRQRRVVGRNGCRQMRLEEQPSGEEEGRKTWLIKAKKEVNLATELAWP